MTSLYIILIILACAILAFFILVQKPKGGGLSGSFGSMGNQVMGVQKSGDVMEKGTWYTAAVILVLCVLSTFSLGINQNKPQEAPKQEQQKQQPQQQAPAK
ncbi:preprotein translocase subunit SecG [Taibaiella sp. KBW10]|uniref:preprotein translocase subunit SecG n=1 Tax=Taibaiella sp. KBW10 TaxID=2153357 RepID=UPI000F59E617|nr:preprotein translocase subunit SecG [Taibaiella sp. KBW10]RQO32058.1 preprotein translocase subunit SecG [Taibaiella sp. KBW10]